MQKIQFCLTLLVLTGSQVFGEAEPTPAKDDVNVNAREVVPLDQIQTKPWQSSESYPQFAADPAPFPYSYYGGYPQGNQFVQPRIYGPQPYRPQLFQPQPFQPQPFQPQTFQPQTFQPQPFPSFYQPQPLPYPMPQQFQQSSWQPVNENFGTVQSQDVVPQTETGVVEARAPQGIPPNPVETPTASQMWIPPSNTWGNSNGIPPWKRSYTPLPGQPGCFNRCRPSCSPNSCQSSCQSACNIRPTCGRRSQVLYNGSTMICGRQGFNQGGLWPEVNPWQDYQNPWGQANVQAPVAMNGLVSSSRSASSNNDQVPDSVQQIS